MNEIILSRRLRHSSYNSKELKRFMDNPTKFNRILISSELENISIVSLSKEMNSQAIKYIKENNVLNILVAK